MQVCFQEIYHRLFHALQSDWLHIHVTTAALGEAILAISFAAGLIYLIKSIDQSQKSKKTFWLETIMFSLICVVGFVVVTSFFFIYDYETSFTWVDKNGAEAELEYTMPALIGPHEGEQLTKDRI